MFRELFKLIFLEKIIKNNKPNKLTTILLKNLFYKKMYEYPNKS